MATFITKQHLSRRTVLKGLGVTVALPVLDAMLPAAAAYSDTSVAQSIKTRLVAIEQVHGAAGSTEYGLANNLWSPAAVGREFDLTPSSLRVARTISRVPDHHQQYRRADGRGAERDGDRRRPLPCERRVSHTVASAPDAGVERVVRHVPRSDVRAETRTGHADSVDAVVDRERGPGWWLRVRVLVVVHGHDQLGQSHAAAADDSRSPRCVRSALWRWRDNGAAGVQPSARRQHPRFDHGRGESARLQSSVPPIAGG